MDKKDLALNHYDRHQRRITPENIISLERNEIFVFGSNREGQHLGGAARFAREKFGAQMGVGEGYQGDCYAIPTMEGLDNLHAAVDRFIQEARGNEQFTYLVTAIGCGIAGYTPRDVAPFFLPAQYVFNIHLPASFWQVIHELKYQERQSRPYNYTSAEGERAVYTGPYVNDRPEGVGTLVFEDDRVYNGNFIAGRPNGYGRVQYPEGSSFEGNFEDGQRNGFGFYRTTDVIIEGKFKNGDVVSDGRITRHTKVFDLIYEGQIKNGHAHGMGRLQFPGFTFEGYFINGVANGDGSVLFKDGKTYTGNFNEGLSIGGLTVLPNGMAYTSDFDLYRICI